MYFIVMMLEILAFHDYCQAIYERYYPFSIAIAIIVSLLSLIKIAGLQGTLHAWWKFESLPLLKSNEKMRGVAFKGVSIGLVYNYLA